MSKWQQAQFSDLPHGPAHDERHGAYNGQARAYDPAFRELSARTRNSLLAGGIRSLQELTALTEEDLLQLRNVGPVTIGEVQALLARYPEGHPFRDERSEADRCIDYEPYLPQLGAAYHLGVGALVPLSSRAQHVLASHSITTAASLILISQQEIKKLRSVGTVISREIITLQSQLAERFGLQEVAGTANLSAIRVLHGVLTTQADARRAVNQQERRGQYLEQLREYGELLRDEFRRGRLSGQLLMASPVSDADQTTLLWEFVDNLCEPGSTLTGDREADLLLLQELIQDLRMKSVDEELKGTLQVLPERQLTILRYRYDPFSPMTLGQVGNRLGVTRERVRQLQTKGERLLTQLCRQHPTYRLRSAIHFAYAVDREGGGLPDIEADLKDRKLILSDEAFDDFLVLWRAIDLERPFVREQVAAAKEGLSPKQLAMRKELSREAAKLCRNCGAFQLPWLSITAQVGDVQEVLLSLGYEEILPSWFWRDVAWKDVVERIARKVFAVTDRIAPREFRLSVAKHLARRDFPTPPTSVLKEVVLRLGFVEVDGDELVSARRFDPLAELNGAEAVLHRFLVANGPVVTFQELFEANRAANYTTITLAVRLKQSPIIRKVKHGLYALVGPTVTQADVDAASARIKEVHARSELRYNLDGTVTYLINAGSWLLYGVVMSAADLNQFAGEWHTPSGAKVTIGMTSVWGLDPLIDELGLELGERIAMHLDTWQRTVTLKRASEGE